MGYDCYAVDTDGNDLPEASLGEVAWEDDAAVEAAFARQYASHTYLRRNIWGMGPLRAALAEIGMGYQAVSPPDWDALPEVVPDYDFDEVGTPITEQGKRYVEAHDRLLRDTGDERPGIALHKLCTNDGWWVTEVECYSALQLWERAGKPMPESFGDDFIPFLQKAAAHGGFKVW